MRHFGARRVPALLDDCYAALIPPDDADALVGALRRTPGDGQQRSRLAARGYDRFRTGYSAEAVFPHVERIWLYAARTGTTEGGRGRTPGKGTE